MGRLLDNSFGTKPYASWEHGGEADAVKSKAVCDLAVYKQSRGSTPSALHSEIPQTVRKCLAAIRGYQ